jgi:hypothetical protein
MLVPLSRDAASNRPLAVRTTPTALATGARWEFPPLEMLYIVPWNPEAK